MAKLNKDIPGAVKVRKTKNGREYIYIRAIGTEKFVATGLINNKANILKAEQILKKLTEELNTKTDCIQNSLFSHFEEFLKYKEYKGVTSKTIKSYRHTFGIYYKYDIDIKEMVLFQNKKIYKFEYIMYHKILELRTKNQHSTINKHLFSCLFVFFKYLYEEEVIEHLIRTNKYILPPQERKAIQIYKQEELVQIYWAIIRLKYKHKWLIMYWYLFLNYTGSRKQESLDMTWDNIDFENKIIKFRNKIKKNKIDYFPMTSKLEKLLYIIKNYNSSLKPKKNQKEKIYLFPLSEFTYSKEFAKILKSIGLKEAGRYIHSLRKSFASRLYELRDSGAIDGSIITELIRHKDKDITDKYYRKYSSEKLIVTLNNAGL